MRILITFVYELRVTIAPPRAGTALNRSGLKVLIHWASATFTGAHFMNKPTIKSHLAIALQSIDAFANNGKLDAHELQHMLDTALTDGEIDAEERRVLAKIVAQAAPTSLDAETIALLVKLKMRHGIG